MDHLEEFYNKFLKERQQSAQGLFERYKGPMVGVVVDTNDPINMHRLRVKIPELHDWDMNDEYVPWARSAPWMGGSISGSWTNYSIGDLIYVMYEKNHPYNILYFGSADATRRARYVLDSVYAESPPVLSEDGQIDEIFESNNNIRNNDGTIASKKTDNTKISVSLDYVPEWLPGDRRPASSGMKSQYGHCFIMKEVGWYPKVHDKQSTPTGIDPLTGSQLSLGASPKQNEPDAKYMALHSKYGNYFLLSDIGYNWWEEFKSDWDNDKLERKWERDRCNYYTKAFTEQEYKNRDQRRLEMRTRYGHMMEMRDVGWRDARVNEYHYEDEPEIAFNKIAYNEDIEEVDHRWVKIRSKGGHLLQFYDKGMDPKDDSFVSKKLSDYEFGEFMDQECPSDVETPYGTGFWHDRSDARFIRMISRYGYKFAFDDRGTHRINAHNHTSPYGNGCIIKGRREGRDGLDRGFGFEFNEKSKLNHMMMYSPKSKVFEINDQYDYMMMNTDVFGDSNDPRHHISESMQNRGDNEFSTKIAMANLDGMGEIDPRDGRNEELIPFHSELHTFHSKLDKSNGYIRHKTSATPGVPAGLESRNGSVGGNWTEVNDHQDRGLWFSNDKSRSVWRSQTLNQASSSEPTLWQALDESSNQILIVNNGNVTQVYAANNLEFIAGNEIMFSCGSKFSVNCSSMHVNAGAQHILDGAGIGTTGSMDATSHNGVKPGCFAGPGCGSASPRGGSPSVPTKRQIDKYKPDGFLEERAADNNIYEAVNRKTDIWGEQLDN